VGDETVYPSHKKGICNVPLSFLDRDHSVARPGYSRWLVPPAALAIHLSIGQEDLFRHEKQSLGLRFDVVNLANVDGLYNFLSTFSGTHFISPRSITAQIHYTF